MNRRELLADLSATVAARSARPTDAGPEVAFTFDDPKTQAVVGLRWQEVNERILGALDRHRVKSTLFVCGMRIDSPAGHDLIAGWDGAQHLIANHTYSHLDLNRVTVAEFETDTLRNEPLIAAFRHLARLFRFPYFKEGDAAEKRDGMRAFLRRRGYRIGRATIDASDWAISARLEKRFDAEPAADLTRYRDFFLQHIWERARYYDSLARQVWPHPVRHTVLLHHNALNARFLDDLIGMFATKGWRPVDAQYAYGDPIYDRQPNCLPAGESLIWAMAKETGRFEGQLRYPGEDDVYENPKMDALKL